MGQFHETTIPRWPLTWRKKHYCFWQNTNGDTETIIFLFNENYKIFITIPKRNSWEYSEYWFTEIFVENSAKDDVLLHIQTMWEKSEYKHYAFCNIMITQKSLFCMRTPLQKIIKFRKSIHKSLQTEKAFGPVPHEALFQ